MAKKQVKSKKSADRLRVEYVDINILKEWDKNPRKNDETVESIVCSIERFGYTNPILVRKADNRIIAGHTRVKALKEIGEKKAPVIFLDIGKTDADLYALFDNKSTENTPWDIAKLSELFADLTDIGADLELTGFSPEEIAGLNSEKDKEKKEVEIPDEQYNIVVECKNEKEQKKCYDLLNEKGYQCRLLTI